MGGTSLCQSVLKWAWACMEMVTADEQMALFKVLTAVSVGMCMTG